MIPKKLVFFILFILVILPLVLVRADPSEQIVQGVENVSNKIDQLESERWDFLGGEWKALFLKNKVVAGIDTFFHEANFLFVLFFARSYDLSMTMLFSAVFWFITFFSLMNYTYWFKDWQRQVIGVLGTIILAHLQIFNKLSEASFKVIFYEKDGWWSFFTFLFLIIAVVVFFYLNKIFGRYLKLAQKAREQRIESLEVKLLKKRQEAKDKATN